MSSESVPDASLICKELMRSWFREHGVGPPKLTESPVYGSASHETFKLEVFQNYLFRSNVKEANCREENMECHALGPFRM